MSKDDTEAGMERSDRALRPLRALLPYLARYKGRAALAVVALTVAALATLTVPLAVRQLIDFGFGPDDGGVVDSYFAALIAVVAVLSLASASRFYLVMTLGERIVADLRRDLFDHLLTLDAAFFDRARAGEITSRLTADATQVKAAVGASASIALRNLVMFTGASIMMVVTSPGLSGLVLLVIPIIVLPLVWFGRRVRARSRAAQDTLADASALAGEAVSGVRTIQSFTHEERSSARFAAAVERAYATARSANAARAWLTAFSLFIVFASVVGVLWWGAQAVVAGTMSPGRLGQFVLYAVFAAGALGELSQVWGEVSQAAGALERINALLRTPPAVAAPAAPATLAEPARGKVEFADVGFAYGVEGAPVLDDVSFTVEPGRRVAFVGPSGAGKSTLFALAARFYDPSTGEVRIDDVPVARLDPQALRRRLSLVSQEPMVFAASASENIRYGRPEATDEEVRKASRAANADDFLSKLPQGYDTVIGERGVTLSGGQRQRLAIARALLKNAPVLLLDEATSALDAEGEALVQDALERLMEGRTTLVIAHRLATVVSADRILVMDEGRVVEEGTHAELVRRGGLYARLAELQFDRAAELSGKRSAA